MICYWLQLKKKYYREVFCFIKLKYFIRNKFYFEVY